MGCIFQWNEAKKKIQNGRLKNSKWPPQKKTHFPAPPILNIFSWNFHGLVLGLVELIDAKGIDVYMNVRLSDISSKTGKKCTFWPGPNILKGSVYSVFCSVVGSVAWMVARMVARLTRCQFFPNFWFFLHTCAFLLV